ncbi:MAG: cupin domain-containing protein, partial [Fimbriiglobus sp.]
SSSSAMKSASSASTLGAIALKPASTLGAFMLTAADVIRLLALEPHPVEGGYFRETHRTAAGIPGMNRSVGTAIYFLLTGDTVSEMHRLPGDEVFHFYLGDPIRMLQLRPGGEVAELTLGPDLLAGQRPQLLVPGGAWQGSHVLPGPHGFCLLGATMAPGFDYADYATGPRAEMLAGWPTADAGLIARLTPKG